MQTSFPLLSLLLWLPLIGALLMLLVPRDNPKVIRNLAMIISLADLLIAVLVFCVAMRWLSTEADLETAARSWTTTIWLVTLIYLIPLGFFYIAATVALVTGTSFNINLGPAGLLLLPVFCLPLIHLFISTSRMRSEAEGL